jgi:2-dehydro-3-deoxyphosphogluconate aldolase/(4S)-4-hydroxy-2-oxoglutarate aldolase
MNALDVLNISPVVPVVVLENADDALPLAEALLEGGIAIMEITLRSDAAIESIRRIAKTLPKMAVGAGTVIHAAEMQNVHNAGGQFCFSPGISAELIAASEALAMTFIPGVATASEVMQAINAGITGCKLFPATAVGGINLLKGFAGPFASMRFCPTGGVTLANMNDFLGLKNVVCVGGSWIVPHDLIAAGDFAAITTLCREAIANVQH